MPTKIESRDDLAKSVNVAMFFHGKLAKFGLVKLSISISAFNQKSTKISIHTCWKDTAW
jgi:hypothetical protein